MVEIWSVIDRMDWVAVAAFFFAAAVLHELEEWNIAAFERRHFTGLPREHSDRNARAWIGVFLLALALICLTAVLPGDPVVAAWMLPPAAFFLLANSAQHLYWTIRFHVYSPGLATTLLGILPAAALVILKAAAQGPVFAAYSAALAACAMIGVAHTIRAGSVMTPIVHGVYRIGAWWADRIAIPRE